MAIQRSSLGPIGSGLVSCIVFLPRNSAGRGLVDAEVGGDLCEGVGTGSVSIGDRMVSVASCFGNLSEAPGRP